MSTLNKQNLINTFKGAKGAKSSYVALWIEAEGVDEYIVVPEKSFDAKLDFYKRSYSDELVHVMNSKVFIKGMTYGGLEVLEELL